MIVNLKSEANYRARPFSTGFGISPIDNMAAEVNLLGELEFSDWVTSLDCHPSEEIFVSGLINGEMFL